MSDATVKHDYHLVNPSPWPVAASISLFLLAVGFAFSQQMVLRAGVFSIGSAGFACIGAYAVGILVKNHGLHPLIESGILLASLSSVLLNLFFNGASADSRDAIEAAKQAEAH